MTDFKDDFNGNNKEPAKNYAADLIRKKIDNLYDENRIEPNAKIEVEEVEHANHRLSKHQQYMRKLTDSGMSLEQIQTSWHSYYASLPDNEKHDVWKEFYAEHERQKSKSEQGHKTKSEKIDPDSKPSLSLPDNDKKAAVHHIQSVRSINSSGPRNVTDIKSQLLSKARSSASTKLKAKQQFQSLLFGVGMGSLVVLILLFGFFNDRFIAPFITPSKNVSATPIIMDGSTTLTDPTPKIVIPKINVEIPVVYDEPSVEEHAIQNALERGVVHYANTPLPGEKGNSVIFGHSSNNILNKGKYKFAFVLLNRMEIGDTFYLTKDKTRFAYRINEKKIVDPTELSVLNSNQNTSVVTLITCDPPGTTLHRLVVVGEQVSPDPNGNKDSSVNPASGQQPTILPSNAESLWQRIKNIF